VSILDLLLIPFWIVISVSFLTICYDLLHIFDKMPRAVAIHYFMFGPFAFAFKRVRDEIEPSRIKRLNVSLKVLLIFLLFIFINTMVS
jgi:hypothetical protein